MLELPNDPSDHYPMIFQHNLNTHTQTRTSTHTLSHTHTQTLSTRDNTLTAHLQICRASDLQFPHKSESWNRCCRESTHKMRQTFCVVNSAGNSQTSPHSLQLENATFFRTGQCTTSICKKIIKKKPSSDIIKNDGDLCFSIYYKRLQCNTLRS